jgi:hypothetical protein
MSPIWIAVVTGLMLLTTGVAAWWYARKPVALRNDHYTAEPLIAREQVAVLDYLIKTFPGQVVMPNVLLCNMLSARRAANHQRAKERLGDQKVDFVVCGEDGRPLFAFDLERHHLSDAAAKAHQADTKKRILRTAGVQLVHMQSSTHHMPTPDALREQLNLAALPQPRLNRRATDGRQLSARQQLESHFSEFDTFHSSSVFQETEVLDMTDLVSTFKDTDVLGMTDLAELDDMLARPGSRCVRGDHHGPDSLPSSRSGFGGGALNARGG